MYYANRLMISDNWTAPVINEIDTGNEDGGFVTKTLNRPW